ncbi:hypothetical protein [Kineococcus sp. SYSU DK006]|uniref:hypothetical protein n=1 Tax=Kineococcus sp. SYSU DK006 TaxID=3383127 RepID=UPI003D7ECA8D
MPVTSPMLLPRAGRGKGVRAPRGAGGAPRAAYHERVQDVQQDVQERARREARS